MKVAIHQPNVLPWFGYFAKMAQADFWIVLDDVQYSHGQYGNRVEIASADGCGAEWLTLPVRRHLGQSFQEVRLLKHDTTEEAFGRLYDRYIEMPFGEQVLEQVKFAVIETGLGGLAKLNEHAIRRIASMMQRLPKWSARASQLRKAPEPGEAGLVQLCKAVEATTYVSGSGGQAYADQGVWAEAGIAWERFKFTHPQYEGMPRAGLSIIDALCRIGPEETAKKIKEAIS